MGRRRKGEHALGPYPDGDRFHVIHVGPGPDGKREYRYFATEERAKQYRDILEEQIGKTAATITEALDAYQRYLTVDKGNKPKSYTETIRRLKKFFPILKLELDLLTAKTCQGYYDVLSAELAADSHRNMLAEARTFLRWCVGKRWMARNPLDGVVGVGKRRSGKPQLRIDEARKWIARALELADAGEDGAVAALMALLLGMRCSEIVNRQVRDVDDAGRLLWIPDSKTDAGKRTVEVPAALIPRLVALTTGRTGEALLFPGRTGKGRGRGPRRDRKWPTTWVSEIAEQVGVPHVSAHGMRGLHATLAAERGVTGQLVATALGHETYETTARSYATRGSVDGARRRRALTALDGGIKPARKP